MGVFEPPPENLAEIVMDEYFRDDIFGDEEEEDSDDYSDGETTSSNESGDAVIIEEDDEDAEDLFRPFIPFNFAPDNFNHFFDLFRRIASGFSSSMYRLDTLPLPLSPAEDKIDVFNGHLPHSAHIAIHRTYIVPPFTNILVSVA